MSNETLVLDMGGSAIKAGIFENGKLTKTESWRHRYNEIGLENSKDDLLHNCIAFADENVCLIGLAITGLLATDGTIFESRLMSSFNGFNVGNFLKTELSADGYSQDNDADCGAIGEFHFAKEKPEIFYVVVGSGIGSAAVDKNGHLLYPVRIDRSRPDGVDMNHPVSDAGLILKATSCEIEAIFRDITPEINLNKSSFLDKFRGDSGEVMLAQLGGTVGVYHLLNVIWNKPLQDREVLNYYRGYSQHVPDLSDLFDLRYAAKTISLLAEAGDMKSQQAFRLMGRFLGLTIAKAEHIILKDHGKYYPIHVGGIVLSSRELFWSEIINEIRKNKIMTECTLSDGFMKNQNSNLWGAYIQSQRV